MRPLEKATNPVLREDVPLLSVRGLSIALPAGADRSLALDDVSFDVRAGEILCIVGESGSGKSLTTSALLGILPDGVHVTAGEAAWKGQDELLSLPLERLRKLRGHSIGMIFQDPMSALNPLHTVGRQLGEVFRVHTALSRQEIRLKCLELLQSVQIPDPQRAFKAYPHQLSGGQRQRVMIAMALALDPALLIADEPTTALDVTTQAQILKLIHDLQRRRNAAVLFITHDFGVVADIADRIAVMQRGKLVEVGPAQSVLNTPSNAYTQRLISAVPTMNPPARRPLATAEPGTPLALETRGLTKVYRSTGWFQRRGSETVALSDVSLTLAAGTTLGIVGESGSGKSTLARTLLGLIEPEAGDVRVAGHLLSESGLHWRRERAGQIQMVFQDPYGSLNPRHRVGEIVAQGPIVQGVPRARALARSRELFELVGLDPNAVKRYPHEFSGGQRQRIGLARALALEPRVLVADEPVSALDVTVQAQVLALLEHLREQLNLSILFITHDLRVAAQVCDRIAVMKDGRVVEEGPSAMLFQSPEHPYTQALIAAVPGRHWNHSAAIQAA
jgi:peptide/nickel transport system ATP-binding protein